MRNYLAVLTILFVCGPLANAESLNLKDTRDWVVVVADDAIPSERYAAEEFQSLFKRAMGFELPILNAPRKPHRNVFIGPGAASTALAVAFQTRDLDEEELRIKIERDNITISGGRPRGTLYGVYEFMERYLGIRFLTHDHTYIPEMESVPIPIEEFQYKPPFSFRWSYYKANSDHPDFAARLRVNTTTQDEKLGGATRQSLINHSFYWLLPVAEYGKTHPEYFALIDGKRVLDPRGGGPELCVSNPEAIDIIARKVLSELARNPDRENFSVSKNDNDAYCHCDSCEAINRREGVPTGSHLALVNAVADRVAPEYPDVKIGTLAYLCTRKPPATLRPKKNVQIQLCSIECCTVHPIEDPNCVKNREFRRDLENWAEICDDIWVWNYNTNFAYYDLPFANLRSIAPNVRYFQKNNVKGLFMQANGNGNAGEMGGLRNYVISRCIWNPSLDGWKLVEEFCRLHYRGAAQPILDYLTVLHESIESSGCHPGCASTPEELGLTPELSEKAFMYFENALEMADDDVVRARVEKASICAYKAVLETCALLEYADGQFVVRFPVKYGNLLDRYIALCDRYNMSRTAETQLASDYIAQISRAAEKGIPAERLENAVWRLTIIPEDNGKIVEMIHKPSNRNVLVPRERGSLRAVFSMGTLREVGLTGYECTQPAAFEAVRTGNSITMTKILPDGSELTRRIQLKAGRPGVVFFETRIVHNDAEPKIYQFEVVPHFHTLTKSDDASIVTTYVKLEEWTPFNSGWREHGGPLEHLLERGSDAYALFNHEAGCGVVAKYDPAQIPRVRLWWEPNLELTNLELVTPPVNLKKGDSFSFNYQFEHLAEAPE